MECGINGKVMQRLEEARAKRERRIQEPGVTGEVIHEKSSLQRGQQQRAGGQEMDRVMEKRWKFRVCEQVEEHVGTRNAFYNNSFTSRVQFNAFTAEPLIESLVQHPAPTQQWLNLFGQQIL